jgi:hypothetical protein
VHGCSEAGPVGGLSAEHRSTLFGRNERCAKFPQTERWALFGRTER